MRFFPILSLALFICLEKPALANIELSCKPPYPKMTFPGPCPTGNKCSPAYSSGQCCLEDMMTHPGSWQCNVNTSGFHDGCGGAGCTWWFKYDPTTKQCTGTIGMQCGQY
ncbi:MAG: hypothetical protein ACD_16C00132G0010 [uncultured bacterium]|nr:MAG: hypothetical protein ACD_16C00132G0010 [uncultured bacterium]